jgi:hypothetical protein
MLKLVTFVFYPFLWGWNEICEQVREYKLERAKCKREDDDMFTKWVIEKKTQATPLFR